MTMKEFRKEVLYSDAKKQKMIEKMTAPEQTLFRLFKTDNSDTVPVSSKVIVEITDRPDVQKSVLTKV